MRYDNKIILKNKVTPIRPLHFGKVRALISSIHSFLFTSTAALNPKFRYAAGQTYTYNFQANSRTWMMGTSDDKALLEVKGQALVTFRAPCDAVLQLRQITISGLDEKVGDSVSHIINYSSLRKPPPAN